MEEGSGSPKGDDSILDYIDSGEEMDTAEVAGSVIGENILVGGEGGFKPSGALGTHRDFSFSDLAGEINLMGSLTEQDLVGAPWFTPPSVKCFELDRTFKHTMENLSVFTADQTAIASKNYLRFKKFVVGGDFGALPHSGDVKLPLWNINRTSFSNVVTLWDENSGSFLKKIPEKCNSPYPSLSFIGQSCKCSSGPAKITHDFRMDTPAILLIGDESIPPILGCLGTHCPLVIRVPGGGDFSCLVEIFKSTFFPTKPGGTNLPPNSIVYICLNSMLHSCPPQMLIFKLVELINTLGEILERSINLKNIQFIPLVFPCPDTLSGTKFHLRITELIEILKTVRGEVDGKIGELLFTGFSWAISYPTSIVWQEKTVANITCENVYIPPCKFLGLPNGLNVLGGKIPKLTKTAPNSPACNLSLNASVECNLWNFLGLSLNEISPTHTLPCLRSLKASYIMGGRACENNQFFEEQLDNPSKKPDGLIIVGHSLGKRLKDKLEREHGFCDIEIFSPKPKQITSNVLDETFAKMVGESQILRNTGNHVIIICCLGNSLFKTEKGLEKEFNVTHVNKRLHLSGQVMPISDEEFFKLLVDTKDFAESLQGMVEKIVIIPPIPRHFNRCCENYKHFNSKYSGFNFVSDVRDWGVFMSQSSLFNRNSECPILVPALTSIFGADLTNSKLLGKDDVHLAEKSLDILAQAMSQLVEMGGESGSSNLLLNNDIPANLSLSLWKDSYRKSFKPLTKVIIAPPPRGGDDESSGTKGQNRKHRSTRPYNRRQSHGTHRGVFGRGGFGRFRGGPEYELETFHWPNAGYNYNRPGNYRPGPY